jgi:uncharacterized protein YdeI (YjbR/CyaY-like superfamily)
MKNLPRLEVGSAQEWRRWLDRHHSASDGVWLVFRKVGVRAASMSYRQALEEALCFGWIDSIVKRESAETYLRKFTPRANAKNWSETNKRLARALICAGRMKPAGLKVIGVSLEVGAHGSAPVAGTQRRSAPTAPTFIQRALASRPKAAAFYAQLAPGYRQRYLDWILSAKQEATRARRLAEAVVLLERGVKSLLK